MQQSMPPLGLLIGNFAPLHLGHLQDINHAAGQCERLHIVIMPNAASDKHAHPTLKSPTLQDKVRWLQMACQAFDFVHIHTLETLFEPAVDFAKPLWCYDVKNSTVTDSAQTLTQLSKLCHDLYKKTGADTTVPIGIFYRSDHAKPTATMSDSPFVWHALVDNAFDYAAIYANPVAHFAHIAPSARSDYTQSVCIVGGESSGKTTLVHKLTNHYGASVALEMGRHYTHSHLGGSELALQYSDYPIIAQQHWQAVWQARQNATSPIVIVDTDYVTTQAFCETYENKSHPVLSAFAEHFRMDHTLLLTNNVAWVADGMRSLGSDDSRSAFAHKLAKLLQVHSIQPHIIRDPNYHTRYLQAVAYIDQMVLGKKLLA